MKFLWNAIYCEFELKYRLFISLFVFCTLIFTMQYRGKTYIVEETISTSRRKRRSRLYVPYEELSTNKKLLRCFFNGIVFLVERCFQLAVTYWLPPLYYSFFMLVIRRRVAAEAGVMRDLFEIPFTLFWWFNVQGNFLMHSFKDVSLKAYVRKQAGEVEKCCGEAAAGARYCGQCEMYQVADSWHCGPCGACVVGRDYHCFAMNQCVTRQNKRHYLLGLLYAFCALAFTSVYAVFYTCPDDDLNILTKIPVIGKILFLLLFVVRHNYSFLGCWVLFIFLCFNALMFAITFGLFTSNLKYVLSRTTYWEAKARKKGHVVACDVSSETSGSWVMLAEDILGERWYLALLSPLTSSPIPERACRETTTII